MAALDYFRFESGNPQTEAYCGLLFETLDLFGYFENYQVLADGTIWIIPTKMAPSGRMQKDVDAPELIKIDLPPVQLLIDYNISAVSEDIEIELQFTKGRLSRIERKHSTIAYAA